MLHVVFSIMVWGVCRGDVGDEIGFDGKIVVLTSFTNATTEPSTYLSFQACITKLIVNLHMDQ
jgi:hypothetical protein